MVIRCDTDEQFYNCIYAMLTRGAQFNADHGKLTIILTGGF